MRGHENSSKVQVSRERYRCRTLRACGSWERWKDCGRGRIDPVDSMWTQHDRRGIRTHGVKRERARAAAFRAADRVVQSPPRDARAPVQPGRSSMAEQVPPPQPRILYIEDNPESRALVRNVLEARGFDVLEASDGIAGIDLAISAHPDLILCDIEMPGIDGYETATRLRAAARSKTEFMQNLSHELATPLTPITGYLKILKSQKMGELTEPQRKIIDSMQTASERLSRTIDNLVDFATLESGGYAIYRDTFDPVAATKAVLDEERPKAKTRRITVQLDAEALPATGWGDERKLKQALSNVLDNAIKFSPHGGHVLLRVMDDSQRLVFEVYDQGEGMLADEAEKVFDPFFHADRVGDERAPGAGLGLPVAKQIVEAHGGRIWVESPPRNQPEGAHHFSGAEVALWIPMRSAARARSAQVPLGKRIP